MILLVRDTTAAASDVGVMSGLICFVYLFIMNVRFISLRFNFSIFLDNLKITIINL